MNVQSIEKIGTIFPAWELESGTVDGKSFLFFRSGSVRIPLEIDSVCAEGRLASDPFADMSDLEINCVPSGSELDEQHHHHWAQVSVIESQLMLQPQIGHHLVHCAMQAGYDPARTGVRFASWLLNRMSSLIDLKDHSLLKSVLGEEALLYEDVPF